MNDCEISYPGIETIDLMGLSWEKVLLTNYPGFDKMKLR